MIAQTEYTRERCGVERVRNFPRAQYYADLDDGTEEPSRPGIDKPADKIIASLARKPGRTLRHKAVMDKDGGHAEWAATEKRGLAIDILPQVLVTDNESARSFP